jgi:molybdenum cofactor guanylyltransferase
MYKIISYLMENKIQITGFVLAGGKSRRMGTDKGNVGIDGKPMVSYSVEALKEICNSITILANNDSYHSLGYPVHKDIITDSGPLAGIHTGLSISKTDLNIFVSCDSPFVTTDLLLYLVEHAAGFDAVVPSNNGTINPLIAVYKKSCLNLFENRLTKGMLKVTDAIKDVNTKIIELNSEKQKFNNNILANINTPDELKLYNSA